MDRSGPVGLFGWNTVSPDTTTVVMTISTEDAMAVYQETKVHAVALPKGFSVLPQEVCDNNYHAGNHCNIASPIFTLHVHLSTFCVIFKNNHLYLKMFACKFFLLEIMYEC